MWVSYLKNLRVALVRADSNAKGDATVLGVPLGYKCLVPICWSTPQIKKSAQFIEARCQPFLNGCGSRKTSRQMVQIWGPEFVSKGHNRIRVFPCFPFGILPKKRYPQQ